MTPTDILIFSCTAVIAGAIGGAIIWLLMGRPKVSVNDERPEECHTRATLEFWLPEADWEFQHAIRGGDWALIVWNIDQWLRDKLKHGHEFTDADVVLEAIRDELWQEAESHGLSVDAAG